MNGTEIKHLRAAVALVEERNFSRAAARLRIGQSGLTKHIRALEQELGYRLFIREARRVSLTPAGEIFVAEAKWALQHMDSAIHLSRAAVEQAAITLHVGKSPYTDPYLITKLLSLRLPLFPQLKVRLTSKLATDLQQELLSGGLDVAFLTGLPETPKLTSRLVADQPFYVVMLDDDALASSMEIKREDLQSRSCILFERHVQPVLYDDFTRTVRPASCPGCTLHHVMTAEDALQMVLMRYGVAILTKSGAWRILRRGITVRPLAETSLRLRTQLVARSDDESKVVSDLVRSFVVALRNDAPREQLDLKLGR